MKLAWKIIVSTVIVVAFAVGLGGYLMAATAFNTALDTELTAAKDDMRLFTLTLQSVIGANDAAELPSLLKDYDMFDDYIFRLIDVNGNVLCQNGDIGETMIYDSLSSSGELAYRIVVSADTYRVQTARTVSLGGQTVYVEKFRDVTSVFTQKRQNLSAFRALTMIITAASALAVTLTLVYLTAPIRSLTRTTKQLAEGHYEQRAHVKNHDELGELASSFNRMADALESNIMELRDAAERQRDFTSSFAHELKTPLTSVIGYADTLRSCELPPDRRFEAASYIFSEGKRLESMSHSLLDLFALDKAVPELRPVPIRPLCRELARSCIEPLSKKGVRLYLKLSDATVLCEPELLKTLLYNLTDNARKASADSSCVEWIGMRVEGGYKLTVRDHGCGIPASKLAHVTEPFYMLDKSRARAEGGTGLGLALCKRIAKAHGTQLRLESEVGQGTRVSLLLKEAGQ